MTMTMKIATSQIEAVRIGVLRQQDYKCPLCEHPLRGQTTKKRPCLDHDHATGFIRGVLCITCNGAEGRIMKRAKIAAGKDEDPIRWLQRMIDYLEHHSARKLGTRLTHPMHRTENEKRLARLEKAKKARAAAKKG